MFSMYFRRSRGNDPDDRAGFGGRLVAARLTSIVRTLAAITLVATTLLRVSPVAAAGQPIRYLTDQTGLSFVLPGPDVCSVDIGVSVIVNREYETDFPVAPDGSQKVLFTGSLWVRLTNLATGQSTILNISGPAQITTNADGSGTFFSEGLTLNWGDNGIFLIQGRQDTNFNVTGRTTDLCALLAA